MNKEEFLKTLKDSIDILTEETKEQEVEKYRKEIEKQKEEGLTEEQIIKSFKSIEEIQKEIYLSRGINPEKISQKKGSIYKKLEELFQVIHRIVEAMSKNNAKENIKIIIDIIVLLLLVCILKIPFILIRNLGEGVLNIFSIPWILEIWSLIIDIIYIIVAVMVFINVFTKWFKNLNTKKEVKIRGKSLEGISLTKEE